MKAKHLEWLLLAAIFFHLQWFFGNLYEAILAPNSIAASVSELNAYNRFFKKTAPYYYYVPLTQIGFLITFILCFAAKECFPGTIKKLRGAAVLSALATLLTAFIVTKYNLKMFFGEVDGLGPRIHQLHIEWAVLNGVRLMLVGGTVFLLTKAYRSVLRSDRGWHVQNVPVNANS